ncbi:MAG: relaxase domain-containing protein [Bryobacterales bacterium]|nr:relaxase domain-containing protein [Bryobacterales bacterium]
MVSGAERIVDAHDGAVRTTLGWVEKNAVLTRMQNGTTGAMVHTGDQKTVAASGILRGSPPPRVASRCSVARRWSFRPVTG